MFLQGQHALAMRCFLQISAQAAFAFLETALSSTRGSTVELQTAMESMVPASNPAAYQTKIEELLDFSIPPFPLPMTAFSCPDP